MVFCLKFIQLVIAVCLLHLAAFFSPKVELPELNLDVAKKLLPCVLVNIIGLVFNTLCLRAVDASFFQVGFFVYAKLLRIPKFISSQHRLHEVSCFP